MKVPLLDLHVQLRSMRGAIDKQLEQVLSTCQFVNGPKVAEFEQMAADYCEVKHAVGVSSGTDALLIALMALDVGPGDIVLTTPYSFFSTAGAISRLNAQPVFVDIEMAGYNLCPDALAQWFTDHPTDADRVKAIIPVHLYGQCCNLEPVLAVARARGIAVIEDAAQAIGSRLETAAGPRRAGALGDIGCFSFFPSKNLGCMGDGGMVTTQDSALADKLRKLRGHGASPKYYHQLIGGNFRLDALQAAVLIAKLPELDGWHAGRQANASYYDEHLAGVGDLVLPPLVWPREMHIYNQYVVRTERRDALRQALLAAEIGSEIYYPVPFHLQECFADLGYRQGDFPNAEQAAEQTLAIPVYPELPREMQDYVVASIKDFYA